MRIYWRSLPSLLLLAPSAALAEVSDKVATVPQLWLTAILAGTVALLAGRHRLLLGLCLLPVSLFLVLATLEPINDPYVAPAVISELGYSYVSAGYGSALTLLGLHAVGLWLGWRRKRAAD
jgi:hypothetical protein